MSSSLLLKSCVFLAALQMNYKVAWGQDTCNHRAYSSCIQPSGSPRGTSAQLQWCQQYADYVDCVEEANCTEIALSQPVHSQFDVNNCSQHTALYGPLGSAITPKILTQDGNLRFFVIGGKDICFASGAQSFCHRDIALDTDLSALNETVAVMLSSQRLNISAELTHLAEDLAYNLSVVGAEANDLEDRLQTMYERELEQNATILALSLRLAAVEDELDGHCGRHCHPGQYASTPCTATSQTICSPCPDNSFSPGGLVQACQTCSSCAVGSQYMVTRCSNISDTVCAVCGLCPTGQWGAGPCTNGSTAHCQPHRSCGAGMYASAVGTPTSDTVCSNCTTTCPINQYALHACSVAHDTVCVPCGTCPDGRQVLQACTQDADVVCGVHEMQAHGGGWVPFTWWRGRVGATLPSSVHSVFENPFGTCTNFNDDYCFGRLPPDLDEFHAELLVSDTEDGLSGNVYRWTFDPLIPASHLTFAAMRDHQATPSGSNSAATRNRGRSWNPQVLLGDATTQSTDSVQFRVAHGVWSFALDDDNCYCHTVIELGGRMCGSSDSSQGNSTGGVEVFDNQCTHSSSWNNSIFLFYRNTSSTPTHRFGTGWNSFWHFLPFDTPVADMLGLAYDECKFSATASGVRYTPAVCPGRMPLGLNENLVQLLAIDWAGNAYRWQFSASCNTAHRAYLSFTARVRGRWAHGCTWNPAVLSGTGPTAAQDSWAYESECGVGSFTLDDDNCYCLTSLEAGKRMCGSSCTSAYGVDALYDSYCNFVSNSANSLTLYYREV
eukprot:m.1476627 g.1476627  ORF g.1476627 m.1476627 type:complete len:779 (-) comp25157_c0_seq38:6290-8626(-)